MKKENMNIIYSNGDTGQMHVSPHIIPARRRDPYTRARFFSATIEKRNHKRESTFV